MIGSNTTQFLYDMFNPAQELNSSNGVVANLLTGLRVDEYFTRTDTATSTFLSDAVGSTIGMVGSGGTIATNYTYEPFGATIIGGSGSDNSYAFTGRENDGNGLYFYRMRYYSPAHHRFIAQDPIGFGGGDVTQYAYVFNSPFNWVDPFGLIINVVGNQAQIADYNQAISYLNQDPGMAQIIQDLQNSSTIYTVMFNSDNNDSYQNYQNPIINWDPHSANFCPVSNARQSPALMLGHELAHADESLWDILTGWIPNSQYGRLDEERVITGPETSAANTLGEDTRTDHGPDMAYRVPGPTAR